MERTYVGIDVSKNTLDLQTLPPTKALQITNDADGFRTVRDHLKAFNVALIVVEATGGYEVPLVGELANAKLPAVVINPRHIRHYAKALGLLAKTDRVDAGVLARFGRDIKPAVRPLPTEEQRTLDELVRRRRQLIKQRVAEQCRLQQTTQPAVLKSIRQTLQFLQRQLDTITETMDAIIQANPVCLEKVQRLTSVKSVGAATARTLLIELPELGQLHRRQVASLVGLAPINRDSGKFRGKRITGGGRANVRTALYMPTLCAIKHNPVIRQFYDHLLQAGKSKMVAVTACMRKLLTILNAILRDKTTWNPNFNA